MTATIIFIIGLSLMIEGKFFRGFMLCLMPLLL